MLNLYVIEQCPYCRKVRTFLDENNVNYNPILCPYPPEDQTNREKLMELGGKGQVPFLHDTEKDITMYESDAIINYIKENYPS